MATFEEGMLKGGKVAYFATGDGPPLVYLPGHGPHNKPLSGFQRKFAVSAVKGMTKHFRVYWINRTLGLQRGATVSDLAADTAAAMEELFDEPVDVVGYSAGGMTAQPLAAEHPHLVRRLVVGGIVHRITDDEAVALKKHCDLLDAGKVRAGMAAMAEAVQNPVGRFLMGRALWLAGSKFGGRNWDPSDSVIVLRALLDTDYAPQLPDIKAPTLLLYGDRDPSCPPDLVKQMTDGIPNVRVVTIPKKGHNGAQLAKGFGEAVHRFLTAPDDEVLGRA